MQETPLTEKLCQPTSVHCRHQNRKQNRAEQKTERKETETRRTESELKRSKIWKGVMFFTFLPFFFSASVRSAGRPSVLSFFFLTILFSFTVFKPGGEVTFEKKKKEDRIKGRENRRYKFGWDPHVLSV